MSTATAVTAADFASELWASVNVEITIFAVTLAVAMAMRMLTRPSTVGKRAKKVVEGGCSPAGKVERQPSDGFARQRRSPTAGQAPQQSPAAAQPRPCPAAPLQGGALTPAQILNEVVSSVGESKSLKAASRALGLFVRMQQTMAAPGAPSMAKVAQGSQHSALDFYTTVLQCAVRIGRFDLLDTIIDDMVHHDVQRSLGFYELAMKQLAAQKQYSAALKIYDRLSADGLRPSHVTYSCLIGFAAEVGELKRAVEFFDKLSAVTTPSIRAYMTMLRVYAKRQDWRASLALFREMRRRGVRPDALVVNFVLATGIAADQVEAVWALLEEVDAESPPLSDVVSYNTVIKGCAQRGDSEGAARALQRMRQRGLSPNSITFNTTMDAAVRGGQIGEAWKVLAAMRAAKMRPDKFTCSILVKGLAKGAPAEHVQSSLELLAEVGTACDAALLSSLYHNVLEAAVAGPHQELVAKTVAQMRRCGVPPRGEVLTATLGRR